MCSDPSNVNTCNSHAYTYICAIHVCRHAPVISVIIQLSFPSFIIVLILPLLKLQENVHMLRVCS